VKTLPELKVTVFSDYICPFCFIGSLRLERLREFYDLRINWAFIEIHPDTPATGIIVEELGYGETQWSEMMAALDAMAEEEGVRIRPLDRLSNSRRALRLAEAAKEEGAERFYRLHHRLFEAYFSEGTDIGDMEELRKLSVECGLNEETLELAMENTSVTDRLNQYQKMAYQAAVTGTPTYVIGGRKLVGAVSFERLVAAALASEGA
jgi:predicted DsbA family dithiol-disulfide isomerase